MTEEQAYHRRRQRAREIEGELRKYTRGFADPDAAWESAAVRQLVRERTQLHREHWGMA